MCRPGRGETLPRRPGMGNRKGLVDGGTTQNPSQVPYRLRKYEGDGGSSSPTGTCTESLVSERRRRTEERRVG